MGSTKEGDPIPTRRVMLVALALLFLGNASVVAQQASDTASARAQLEARQLLQGANRLPFLDVAEIDEVAAALNAVRAAIPEVRSITNYADESYLVVTLNDRGAARADTVMVREDSFLQTLTRTTVGVRSIDSLNAALGADSVTVHYIGARAFEFRPHFAAPPNVPELAELYHAFPEVLGAGPEIHVGGGDSMRLRRNAQYWYFTFVHAWGDCPSGCINQQTHYVRYSPTSKVSQLVDRLPG